MGKGDKKSRRGKINSGNYGKRRPRKASKSIVASEEKSKK
ncbi:MULTISPECIES: 30S ribosomal protein THX [Chryseobacterium]|nr:MULTISPECIES: 30S ribosomal protein THX [Chryseobacterium]UHO38764.1 30S ribosomal protein THX [Chryseobacterium capnotolerans]